MNVWFAALIPVTACAVWLWRSGSLRPRTEIPAAAPPAKDDEPRPTPVVAYATTAIADVRDDCLKLAFGVAQFDYLILGEHAEVFAAAAEKLRSFTPARDYFPRRPMLLPKLLRALHNDDTTRAALAQMILQDPALAGAVLERANTTWYRTTPKRVESIDRALAMLGNEGLRSIIATFILQPLFRLPTGYFEQFAPITWEQGQRAGFAAQVLAQRTGSGDPLVAQLLATLSALSRIVLFRFTSECYRAAPNILPRAEVFIRLMQEHCTPLSTIIAGEWELSTSSVAALQEQAKQISPHEMTQLGRTLYFADLCGALATAVTHQRHSEEGALSILREQGMKEHDLPATWLAACMPVRG